MLTDAPTPPMAMFALPHEHPKDVTGEERWDAWMQETIAGDRCIDRGPHRYYRAHLYPVPTCAAT